MGACTLYELRDRLLRHIRPQFADLLSLPGPIRIGMRSQDHHYDPRLTYGLAEVLPDPIGVEEHEFAFIESMLSQCCDRIPDLHAACVVENRTGDVLASLTDEDHSQLLLGLCCAGMRRLVDNRVTRSRADGSSGMVLIDGNSAIVVHGLAWDPELSLVIGSVGRVGHLFAVAQDLANSHPAPS